MIFNDSLNYDTLQEEYLAWCKSDRTLRFGQWVCNKYLLPGKSAPEIFYSESLSDAHWLIVDELKKRNI
jgi:hypothetical protein